MTVEFKAVEAIDSLVALLRVAEDAAVHCWEQEEPFDPGIFPGLILLARFASHRAGEEYMKAVAAAEQIRNLEAERNAARELHLVTVRRYNAEVEQRLALKKQLAEFTKKAEELSPEPDQWQVGDEVIRNGEVRSVEVVSRGYVKLHGLYSCGAQSDWERAGWQLHRKASDLPDILPLTPQQVTEFAAVTEPIDDGTGADGERQS